MIEIPPPLFGESLKLKLGEKIEHKPIITGLIYEGASVFFFSQPGLGKSTVSIDAALCVANGLPVFGCLYVPFPMKVWYIQMERHVIESLERLQKMVVGTKLSLDNLYIDPELQAINILNDQHFNLLIKRGKEIGAPLTMIDPTYGLASGLSKDEIGSEVVKRLTILKKECSTTLWLNHHSTKSTYEVIDGKRVKKDKPMFGSQWLYAHATGVYFVSMGENGLLLEKEKDSHGNLLSKIELSFDDETYLSTMLTQDLTHEERYAIYVNKFFGKVDNVFTFDEALEHLKCPKSQLRSINRTPRFQASFDIVKSNGHKSLYRVISLVS